MNMLAFLAQTYPTTQPAPDMPIWAVGIVAVVTALVALVPGIIAIINAIQAKTKATEAKATADSNSDRLDRQSLRMDRTDDKAATALLYTVPPGASTTPSRVPAPPPSAITTELP